MFANKETLTNNVKQINVNIQNEAGSSFELLASSAPLRDPPGRQ